MVMYAVGFIIVPKTKYKGSQGQTERAVVLQEEEEEN